MTVQPRFGLVEGRRGIVDRRAVADRLAAAATGEASRILCETLEAGRAEIARRLAEHPSRGRAAAASYAFLSDQVVRLAFDHVTTRLFANPNFSIRPPKVKQRKSQ